MMAVTFREAGFLKDKGGEVFGSNSKNGDGHLHHF